MPPITFFQGTAMLTMIIAGSLTTLGEYVCYKSLQIPEQAISVRGTVLQGIFSPLYADNFDVLHLICPSWDPFHTSEVECIAVPSRGS